MSRRRRKPGVYPTRTGYEVVMPGVDLPSQCGLEAEFDAVNRKVRWRATRGEGAEAEVSSWSAMYDASAMPDRICWEELWTT